MPVEVMPVEKIKERIGDELGLTDWFQMDQDRIDKFAECTDPSETSQSSRVHRRFVP